MIQSFIEVVKMDTLRVVTMSVLLIIFTVIAVRSELKNWRIGKTLKLFRSLKHEQQQLIHVLRGSKNTQYKEIACLHYLDEQEKILVLMKNGKLQYSLFNDLIKPLVFESINFDIMKSFVAVIKKENQDKDPSEMRYPYLFNFLNDDYNNLVNADRL